MALHTRVVLWSVFPSGLNFKVETRVIRFVFSYGSVLVVTVLEISLSSPSNHFILAEGFPPRDEHLISTSGPSTVFNTYKNFRYYYNRASYSKKVEPCHCIWSLQDH